MLIEDKSNKSYTELYLDYNSLFREAYSFDIYELIAELESLEQFYGVKFKKAIDKTNKMMLVYSYCLFYVNLGWRL